MTNIDKKLLIDWIENKNHWIHDCGIIDVDELMNVITNGHVDVKADEIKGENNENRLY